MKKILFSLLLLFVSAGTATSSTMFYDEILGGTYTFDNSTREMVMSFQTIYSPYDSVTGEFLSDSGAGTTINWVLTLDFTDWSAPGGDLPGVWEESWSDIRGGDFDRFSYWQTGTNDLGQNTGDYFGTIVNVTFGPQLGPVGPWYIFGDLTRTAYNTSGDYLSSGVIEGVVTNTPVPEPATMLLFGAGLIGLAGISIRRGKSDCIV